MFLRIIFVLIFVLMFSSQVFGGYESLFANQQLSRGMTFYFIAVVLLLAIPFMNKYFKTLSFFLIVLFLSRGLMRISDEQDPLRVIYSIESGLKLGLLIAVPLVIISLLALLLFKIVGRAGVILPDNELVDQMKKDLKEGKTLEQIRIDLIDEGYQKEEINKAIEYMRRDKNVWLA